MNAIVASGSVLAACLVVAWAISIRSRVRAKDMYVELFANTTVEFLRRAEFDKQLKAFLVEISAGIQNRKVADYVTKAVADEDRLESNAEVVRLMDGAGTNPTDEQFRFLGAIFLYLMALSFSSSAHGGRLRKRLRAELPDKDALLVEGQRAHYANSSLSAREVVAAA